MLHRGPAAAIRRAVILKSQPLHAKCSIVDNIQRPACSMSSTVRNYASISNPNCAKEALSDQTTNQIVGNAGNFEQTQSTRPDFDHSKKSIEVTKHPNPDWQYSDGIGSYEAASRHVEVDPYASDRPMINNYRLLIAGIAPRPIGFVSTMSKDGVKNLAPMSYFQVVDHDPPTFVIGFSARSGRIKDTYRNLKETGECVINTVSEHMIEAVNATSLDAPYGVSEWDISGLHEAPTTTVRPSRVAESIFSVEGKVTDIKEVGNHAEDGTSAAGIVLIQATRFWVREDATNADVSNINLDTLRPVAQLGGMSYGRITSTFELPRKRWSDESQKNKVLKDLHNISK
ncbi:hypothetical protein BU24DRAFT_128332 [Aaosphaeria arxii CBS 175.79]|uniref:Flavin reductase like domain-containing protein n=1 Tax=Aaosphaeria arxii CBS 175.79 TaxID=1450172 RepID=A0A6A5Y4C4_9PLEO|nr:uncharacterized protein BU24DRAFT_128332 [Aaosphaeria arxii CBS 175.79]KAF2019877.1 hypothetical protein BU24DRAFT_128332 [Aaosphaeria arxii CBS 175.79]